MSLAHALTIEPLGADVVALVHCIAIDAAAFPYPSVDFGLRMASLRALVAREEPQAPVVGFIAGHVRSEALHVEGLAVDQASRRRGAGRALVRAAVAAARAEGLRMLTLHVGAGNDPAITLYHGEGFVIERRLRGFYSSRVFGTRRDAYEMALELR